MSLSDYIENKPTIETERLTLRTMNIEDVEALNEWMPDKEIYRYWGKGPGKTDKKPELLFEKKEMPSKSFHLGIALKNTGKIIGEIWIYLIENDRMAKLAIRIGRKYQKNGYAGEAVEAMIGFCFENTELQRIWTDVDVNNMASIRMLERCGFRKEGTIRQGKMVSTWCDYHLYAILKSDLDNRDDGEAKGGV